MMGNHGPVDFASVRSRMEAQTLLLLLPYAVIPSPTARNAV